MYGIRLLLILLAILAIMFALTIHYHIGEFR